MVDIKTNTILELTGISKFYYNNSVSSLVVSDFNLAIAEQEFVSIIGHSGCGKTTILSMIAGLTNTDAGVINLGGIAITGPGTDRGMVFQSPNLLPNLTVIENVLLGVDQVFTHQSKRQRREKCLYYLEKVGMATYADKRVPQLSQGMKQRVGIARAFAIKPKVLLLDEPFGMLDSLTRMELQDSLLNIWMEEKITAVMVTHDVDEAVYLSDRVVMMTHGPAARVGNTIEIDIERPRRREKLPEDIRFQNTREAIISFLNN